jgi:hypothetical protein
MIVSEINLIFGRLNTVHCLGRLVVKFVVLVFVSSQFWVLFVVIGVSLVDEQSDGIFVVNLFGHRSKTLGILVLRIGGSSCTLGNC